jgi:diaminopimelate epimerase
MNTLTFTKAHGLGNDFILIDATQWSTSDIDHIIQQSPALCDRNRGIGADGVILALPSLVADSTMRVINSDGSEPEMCGNGIRCFAKWLYVAGIVKKLNMAIETGRGILYPELIMETTKITHIKVDMGEPILQPENVPFLYQKSTPKNQQQFSLSTHSSSVDIMPISMGNPHGIIWASDLTQINLAQVGPELSTHPAFPKQANIEFAQIISSHHVNVLVWERGAGATQACGTGACAVAVAGILQNKLKSPVQVSLPGGTLMIEWDIDTNHVFMTGPAEIVFTGTTSL